jgi:DNA-binding IclR family transcriptional regulator
LTGKHLHAKLVNNECIYFHKWKLDVSAPLLAGKRALDIIEMIGACESEISFSELSTKLDISSASLTRLLKVLIAEDWIVRDKLTKKYSVNIRALQLGHSLRNRSPSSEIISPIISDLAQVAGHSACFGAFRGDCFMLLAKAEQRSSYHFIDVFSPNFDWINNAMGTFLLAYQPDEVCEDIYRRHFQMSVPEEHKQVFAEIRRNNFFVRNDDFVTRVIVGVSSDTGRPIENLVAIAALSSEGSDADSLLQIVQDRAKSLEAQLCAQGLDTRYWTKKSKQLGE